MTDQMLAKLERKVSRIYNRATREMKKKTRDQFRSFDEMNNRWLDRVESGKATEEQHRSWLKRYAHNKENNQALIKTLSEDAYNSNVIAANMIKEHMFDVYALNMNYASYYLDRDIGFDTNFTLYDRDAVERLIKEDPDLLPNLHVDKRKDLSWNGRKFRNEIIQGILQGESVQKMADRLERVMRMDENAAIRNARTATTSAENGGRHRAFNRAQDIGVEMTKMWQATMDAHTRHTHRALDGQVVPLNESFQSAHGPLEYPGDPMGDPAETYNCRCRLRGITKYSSYNPKDMSRRFVRFNGNAPTYEEWKAGKNGDKDEQNYRKRRTGNPQR